MSKITDFTAQLARPVVEANGCTLWDVEYVKEAGSWYLRVYIDKDTTIARPSAGSSRTCWTRPTPSRTPTPSRSPLPVRTGP